MKLLRRKESSAGAITKIASTIASAILKIQNCFATFLSRLSKNWRQKEKWIFLYLVCLVFGGLSFIAIAEAFKTSGPSKLIIIKSISLPKNIYKEDNKPFITEKEFQQVEQYKVEHPLLPGQNSSLYDSLEFIEQLYYLQEK